jgi:hypothetical protein
VDRVRSLDGGKGGARTRGFLAEVVPPSWDHPLSVFRVQLHTQGYPCGAFGYDGVVDCSSMICARGTRERERDGFLQVRAAMKGVIPNESRLEGGG